MNPAHDSLTWTHTGINIMKESQLQTLKTYLSIMCVVSPNKKRKTKITKTNAYFPENITTFYTVWEVLLSTVPTLQATPTIRIFCTPPSSALTQNCWGRSPPRPGKLKIKGGKWTLKLRAESMKRHTLSPVVWECVWLRVCCVVLCCVVLCCVVLCERDQWVD